jgi:hypothetical protein
MASGGNPKPANDCSGSFQVDMSAFAAGLAGGAPHAALSVAGQQVDLQMWGRDPGNAANPTFLTDALQYVVGY